MRKTSAETRDAPLWLKGVFFIGPVIFILLGIGFAVGAVTAAPGSTTDDGYPLDSFFKFMSAIFGGLGVLWLIGAVFGLRHGEKQAAADEVRRQHLLQHGLRLQARVVSCESDGYMNFRNEVWTDLVLDYEVPGVGRRQVSRRIALSQGRLDHARAGGAFNILIDPRAPDDYMFP